MTLKINQKVNHLLIVCRKKINFHFIYDSNESDIEMKNIDNKQKGIKCQQKWQFMSNKHFMGSFTPNHIQTIDWVMSA